MYAAEVKTAFTDAIEGSLWGGDTYFANSTIESVFAASTNGQLPDEHAILTPAASLLPGQ
jgi:hypothetical protein